MDLSTLTKLPYADSAVACNAGESGLATASLLNIGGGFTLPNALGVLLVYGLGLILAATLLNRRRHMDMAEAAAEQAPDVELLGAVRARREGSEHYIFPFPKAHKATLLRCLSAVTAETDGRFRVTNRADMARLARPEGVSDAEWYRAMAAYHMTNTDFSVVNAASKTVAAVEYVENEPVQTSDALDRMRRDALRNAGLPIRAVGPDTDLDEVADWLREVLARHG